MAIERSNQSGKFTLAEIQTRVRESRAFWSSPAGVTRQAQLDKESRERKPVARRSSNPAIQYWQRRFALLENASPKI